jgi:uncharacterized protein (DUF1330 family)
MPAYIIVVRESSVRNPEEYAEYQRMNRETPSEVRPKPLVVYGAVQGLEGKAPDGVVMLEFPTVEEARAWYQSPGYQAALPHRLAAAEWRAFIVEGFQPPG